MKIILTSSMSGLGGTENATFRLARLLHQHGHHVILASSDGPLVQDTKDLGISWRPIDFYQSGKTGYLKAALAYTKLLAQEKPDIVHCQMARIVPACAAAAKLASPKTKVFYHARGLDPETYPKIAKLFDTLGVYIIGNCKHEQAKLIRHGFPASRISYTYNALPKPNGSPQKTERSQVVLGTLSRLDKVRAVDLTLDVFKILTDRGLNVRLHIAGIGEEEGRLKQQAQDLGIADKIAFLGGIRDLNAYFQEIDILLNTLNCEGDHGAGVGNNILEAGIYETAVVSYGVIGIPEMIIHGETGFCTPLRDQEKFADAVEKLVRDPALRTRMGKALRQHVEALCSDEEIYRATMAAYRM
ncbi:glycosyltransferase [Neisseria musculi]|uniref:Glycosyl transferases group 1 family protein n=1 Tax=Neisseria musculi TaxID=1815583 RepID=A0A7H1MAH9_9NEIS|nr:glycosyltransferase [Neisseria musculi]QNT58644.1 glycosyl transferases group 1 family protein [Neisseria musculi]